MPVYRRPVLSGYRFEHPRTDETVDIGRWSYLWAGLFGAVYVWHKGFGQFFLKALALNIGFAVLYFAAWAATSIPQVPIKFQGLVLPVLVP